MAQVKNIKGEAITVKVGDVVCFKSDYEQVGQIIEIRQSKSWMGGYDLVLENKNGFGGDYLRYATRTVVNQDDCWI